MTLSAVRQELKEDLASLGWITFDHIPSGVTPPVVLIGVGDPYLEEGDTFSATEMLVHIEIFAIPEPATNARVTDKMDEMISAIVLNTADWHLDGVSAPFITTLNNSQFLACRISLSRVINLI